MIWNIIQGKVFSAAIHALTLTHDSPMHAHINEAVPYQHDRLSAGTERRQAMAKANLYPHPNNAIRRLVSARLCTAYLNAWQQQSCRALVGIRYAHTSRPRWRNGCLACSAHRIGTKFCALPVLSPLFHSPSSTSCSCNFWCSHIKNCESKLGNKA